MDSNRRSAPANDARLAGGLMNVVQQLQKNRFGGTRELQGAPVGGEAQGSRVLNALRNNQSNEQGKDAAPVTETLQDSGSEERGRQRNVGQGKA